MEQFIADLEKAQNTIKNIEEIWKDYFNTKYFHYASLKDEIEGRIKENLLNLTNTDYVTQQFMRKGEYYRGYHSLHFCFLMK